MQARALWITSAGTVALRPENVAAHGDSFAVVRTLFSGISRGTEALVFAGGVPESERDRMRAPYQCGNFGFPIKYGYSNVGLVEQGPPDLLGKCVFCLYPHQDLYAVPASALAVLPQGVPAWRAVLGPNMETALNVIWDSGLAAGDRVAVIGCGVVGALAAYLAARVPGTDVVIVDVQPGRQRIAETFGCRFALPDASPQDCDVVIHTSASSAGLETSIACAGAEATIVEASWYGSEAAVVGLGGTFHSQRLKLISSQVGRLNAARLPRWTLRRRLEAALSLLADDRLDVLVSGETPFAEAERTYASLLADPATLCHRFRYS